MSLHDATTEQARTAIAGARKLFPGAERWTYMDVSLRGILSKRVRAAVDDYLDHRLDNGGDKKWMLDKIEQVRKRYAQLINADPVEIAYTKNVSDGLNMIAGGLSWEAGDNVVVCPELEHPNNVYLWYNLQKLKGVEVRALKSVDGYIPIEVMKDAIDAKTRLLTVPSVTFSPGYVTDLKSLSEACRRHGVFFLVDAAQSVGILHTDVAELGVDALAVATQKGLLAFYGMGFLYCQKEWAERLWPVSLARFSVDLGDAHEAALGDDQLKLNPGARRFDLGNYNYIAAVAAGASMKILLEAGTRNIESHVRHLAHQLAGGLHELGLPVCGGPPGDRLGHIVTVGSPGAGGHDTASDERMNNLHRYLVGNDVKLSIRRGVLRFSLHLYNNEEDVRRVVELARQWQDSRG